MVFKFSEKNQSAAPDPHTAHGYASNYIFRRLRALFCNGNEDADAENLVPQSHVDDELISALRQLQAASREAHLATENVRIASVVLEASNESLRAAVGELDLATSKVNGLRRDRFGDEIHSHQPPPAASENDNEGAAKLQNILKRQNEPEASDAMLKAEQDDKILHGWMKLAEMKAKREATSREARRISKGKAKLETAEPSKQQATAEGLGDTGIEEQTTTPGSQSTMDTKYTLNIPGLGHPIFEDSSFGYDKPLYQF
ncbi:hypothetical protein CTRI78_v005138 [Colletotrichum trifolii]|uniref:Uncharacterized protein n=1 Tax=Colletotrichum trifolii TaxID=5466 RepID=A0A4V6QEX9_COLTR|nr:hypothetical protein CTRI78_v005138 [Colletotrichum trifolii]